MLLMVSVPQFNELLKTIFQHPPRSFAHVSQVSFQLRGNSNFPFRLVFTLDQAFLFCDQVLYESPRVITLYQDADQDAFPDHIHNNQL